jgi:prepilin-type N-terminal cleavage/methylation domain-containing protein
MRFIQTVLTRLQRIRHSRSGFTLVEVLVSVLILAVSLTGALLVFSKSNIFISEIQERLIANQAVKEEVEEIRDMSYASILALGNTFTTTSMDDLKSPVGTLTIDDALSNDDIRRVTATLTWTSMRGRALSTSFSTYVTNLGINRK